MKKLLLRVAACTMGVLLAGNASMWAQTAGGTAADKKIVVYGKDKKVLYTMRTSEVDSIVFTEPVPKADVLDVVFHEDGTAEDVSPMKNEVKLVGNSSYTRYSNAYGRYIATFNNAWAGDVTGYYRIDFENNQEFRSKLADGHTLEMVVMPAYSGTLPNQECKPFSAMQAGGTGFLVTTTSGSRKNEICFLPNVSTNGKSTWRWATSGIVPEPKKYYHVVGVWNKEEEKAYVYVNGQLCNTIAAPGTFRFASSGCNWFCVGGDPASSTSASNGWQGNVVLARIYDAPLTQDEVSLLWKEVDVDAETVDADLVQNVDFLSGMGVKAGGNYYVSGEGFAQGDQVTLTAVVDKSKTYTLTLTPQDGGALLRLPAALESGQYRMTLQRGNRSQELGVTTLTVLQQMPAGMQVIAHRGFWDTPGAAQNSRASLRNAIAQGCYGSETDVWITTDGHVMVNHDPTLGGVRLETSTYDQVKNLTLSNGEKIPELGDFLDIMEQAEGTKLIVEIKTHTDEARGKACVAAVVDMVKARGLQDKVEYIGFSIELCKELVRLAPEAHVAYLNGDYAPAALKQLGIMGLDYTAAKYRSNPTWTTEARALGMTTNVWTINDKPTMAEMTNLGVDFVTTNAPVEAQQVQQAYDKQKAAE